MILVRQQGEVEIVFLLKLRKPCEGIYADTKRNRFVFRKLCLGIAQSAGLHRAARCHCFGVKIEHDPSLALKVLQAHLVAILVEQAKGGGQIAQLRKRLFGVGCHRNLLELSADGLYSVRGY